MEILKVTNLTVKNEKTILKNISFNLKLGKVLGIIGESGSGKTTLSKILLGLYDEKQLAVTGNIIFNGINLLNLKNKEKNLLLGKELTLIPQNPMTAFNPNIKIKRQITDTIKINSNNKKSEILKEVKKFLKIVKLEETEKILNSYPFELSGGQLQRIMFALCLILNSKVIIMDEITSSIDIENRENIIFLIKKLEENNSSIIFITHDFKTLKEIADKVIIMKNGELIETISFQNNDNFKKEYTRKLIQASLLR
ncbi:dipeptide/oligopeptide/nickel ABC transporter ATP-binding protein [Fusobacterium nucleatum]|uniref:ABC transporter ATP-binding protein n=1 Tax=Fusobacterium nucleatum TaxID=851 RepID=UPI0023610FC4|nr:ABC transporter ATP-binding protein [Fusobacterium nucleatum]WDA45039.1 ABC transporter ATP-binding protein [Fusobacterium nucleatum]